MSSVNLKDNIRYSGELNKLHPFERQRYIHNITKNDYLVNLKQKYSKGEYNLLISNLGKTIMDMYSGKIPEYYVDSFWINNIDNLKSIEDNIISLGILPDKENVRADVYADILNIEDIEIK